jgi:large subunit ribosomal protein L9
MEVILNETISTLGRVGDIVKVKPGYGRNYLLPQKKAVIANERTIAQFEQNKAEIESRLKEETKVAEGLAKKLADTTVTIAMLTSDDERLFGSVTASDISTKLAEDTGVTIDKKNIMLADPIKALGENSVTCKVGFQTTVDITVQVVPLAESDSE